MHVVRFVYTESHEDHPLCVVDVSDLQAVELATWWLQVVRVRSLKLENVDTVSNTCLEHITSVVLTNTLLTCGGTALPLVLEELMLEGSVQMDRHTVRLTALQDCQCLQRVKMDHFTLNSLEGFEKLTTLKQVELRATGVGSLTPLSSCIWLEKLCIGCCENVHSLEGFERLTVLREVIIISSNVRSLKPLGQCRYLQKLAMYDCKRLESLEGLQNVYALKELHLSGAKVTDLSCLRQWKRVVKLVLEGCKELQSFEVLQDMRVLTELTLSSTRVNDLNFLKNCTELEYLWLYDCIELQSVQGLEELEKLQRIYMSNDMREQVDLSPIPLDKRGIIAYNP
ncbi:hypothetical protein STCU_11572 [Strigomonas culicis]|uniref:Uncharacterized protein n=1 Tax=Strigomonas culicis TaxID=28005 RepID=S9TGN8_9TRYP|nr:hypothetical protein STCU_11572 [Strigomonas culicis]|eukprot:EPY16064.1 hypothetical protein STCU_11572 [Strigomonas culicis]